MNWNDYVLRRRIDAAEWLRSRGVTNREQFAAHLAEISIELPPSEDLDRMFPTVAVNGATEVSNESNASAPEGIDTATAWSVAGEGDQPSLPPDGKRTSKIRS